MDLFFLFFLLRGTIEFIRNLSSDIELEEEPVAANMEIDYSTFWCGTKRFSSGEWSDVKLCVYVHNDYL